ncbi:XRE family transcriptional regulator [Kaistia geumhonensis]|uniref:DNA-binding transcriptional regulator AlpA n=1 Tax=Kaistia geumhonensis TaxID=410839 RepID=A0ABU0M5Q0_9HYPH|nr:XRE family transcriptional regulator [Kaistia geumhonensis]MCX5478490.1 XRE family transcriptional regulator [Kaistia geumhonensis]MDQ0516292.1 putative DNA-binding transcriptional regulator AlpA [Kaistia geumhonensis]
MNARAQPVTAAAVRPVPRRGLRRDEAATYVGVSPSKFDHLVADGRMPASFQIDGCRVWDIRALDAAFDALAGGAQDDEQEWTFAP